MAIRIGHSSIDENGNAKNGKAGDQNGKEVCIRTWYNKNWDYVLRCKDNLKAEIMAKTCEDGCNNDNIGYDQYQRNSLNSQAQKYNYNLSEIKTPCECDCSSFMTVCAQSAKIKIPYNGYNAPTTRTMKKSFMSTNEFELLNDDKYLNSDKYLKRGDILVKEGRHTVMALDNGSKYKENTNNNKEKGFKCIDVSGYNPIKDYEKVKNDGVQYAILKIIRKDLRLDKLFDTHYNGFKEVGIPIYGVYNYSYATTVNKAKNDAKQVIEYLKRYNLHCKVFLDVENECQKNLGSLLIDIINAYQDIIVKNGYIFGLYTGKSFYNSYIKPYKNKLKCKNEWIARYYNGYNKMDVSEYPNEKYKPNIGTEIEAWQYTSSCIVDGIDKTVDMSILYTLEDTNDNNDNNNDNNDIKINNVVYNCYKLNIREKPNSLPTTKKVGLLLKGDKVNIYGYKNNFYQIGDNKWVSAKYINSTNGIVTANALNVREGINTSYKRIDIINKGTIVKVINRMDNGWYMIQNKNYYGYVSDKYLKEL